MFQMVKEDFSHSGSSLRTTVAAADQGLEVAAADQNLEVAATWAALPDLIPLGLD